ncbi:MAG TPA: zinc ribbon domain-containing protein [Vicinamibacterales bacterium]|nr:zinc ribbon domain-containing protein [Vicinamibacterales bacterium]
MPLYEYECDACGHRFEKIQKFSDPPADVCPKCGEKKVHKLMSSPAIKFKGSGFYINDYAPKSAASGDSKESAAKKDTASKDTTSKDSGSSDSSKSASASSDKTPAASKSSTE